MKERLYRHHGAVCGGLTSVKTDASQYIYSWFVDAVIVDFASYLAEKDEVFFVNSGERTVS